MITSNQPKMSGSGVPLPTKIMVDSHDTKPTNVKNGARLKEIDTGKEFIYNEGTSSWDEQPSEGGEGGGGSSTLSDLTDVDISNPSNGQTLVYNATTQKWENAAASGHNGPDAIITENRDDSAGTYSYVLSSGSYNDLLTKLQAHLPIKVVLERTIDYGNDEFELEAVETASVAVSYYEASYHEIYLFFVLENHSGVAPIQYTLFILADGTVTDRLE